MPMTYEEMKHEILFHYHKNIDFWFKIVGEMYEATKGFKNSASIKRIMNGVNYNISWGAYDWAWNINEI